MALHRNSLPQLAPDAKHFLTYTGMETDLLFTKGIDLPGFASFPLLETDEGRRLLKGYYTEIIRIGSDAGLGVILESATWVANRDRGAAIGYTPEQLGTLNKEAIALMSSVRARAGDEPTVLSANIGPRFDAYAATSKMSVTEAAAYHAEQTAALASTELDLITGYTLACPMEAAGMVLAAKAHRLPIVIAFTVETNGALPSGDSLKNALRFVDEASDSYASYFMVNCAHPDHFGPVLTNEPWMHRLKGIVANASRCSHEELDQAETLDDGNPSELAKQLAAICAKHQHINVIGGCCGTDARHLSEIASAVSGKAGRPNRPVP